MVLACLFQRINCPGVMINSKYDFAGRWKHNGGCHVDASTLINLLNNPQDRRSHWIMPHGLWGIIVILSSPNVHLLGTSFTDATLQVD